MRPPSCTLKTKTLGSRCGNGKDGTRRKMQERHSCGHPKVLRSIGSLHVLSQPRGGGSHVSASVSWCKTQGGSGWGDLRGGGYTGEGGGWFFGNLDALDA